MKCLVYKVCALLFSSAIMSHKTNEESITCYCSECNASSSTSLIQTDCYQKEIIQFNEHSPLLSVVPSDNRNNHTKRICDKIFFAFLLFILLVGLNAGIYLLAREGHEWRALEAYNLTTRQFWQAQVPSSTMPELKLPVAEVLFLQTNSTGCDSKFQCAKLVHELQLKHMRQWKEPDIFYNFIVSGDGSIFEGRGWKFQTTFSEYSSSTAVTVAFLGKFNINPPTPRQVESAQLLVDVAVMEGKLKPCYQIRVWGKSSFFDIAQRIQRERFNCQDVT